MARAALSCVACASALCAACARAARAAATAATCVASRRTSRDRRRVPRRAAAAARSSTRCQRGRATTRDSATPPPHFSLTASGERACSCGAHAYRGAGAVIRREASASSWLSLLAPRPRPRSATNSSKWRACSSSETPSTPSPAARRTFRPALFRPTPADPQLGARTFPEAARR